MKRLIGLLGVLLLCLTLIACDSENHDGKAKTPSGSSVMAGRNYEDVVEIFKENGFVNIKTEPIYDLVTGLLTKDNEVEKVSVGGDFDYSADEWISSDIEVIIYYHTFPADNENINSNKNTEESKSSEEGAEEPKTSKVDIETLTIDNCPELKTLLALKDPDSPFVKSFVGKYMGKTIEFDGNIAYMNNHDTYKTRYDILIYAGDYSETSAQGPNFQLVDVNMSDLNFVGENTPDYIGKGDNIHIVAEISEYNEISGIVVLEPVSTKMR